MSFLHVVADGFDCGVLDTGVSDLGDVDFDEDVTELDLEGVEVGLEDGEKVVAFFFNLSLLPK